MIGGMGSTRESVGGGHRRRGGRTSRRIAVLVVASLLLAGCGGGGGSGSDDSGGTGPTTSGGASATTIPPILTTVLVGTVVGGNSGGVGENQTDSLSETVRTSETQCRGWFGQDDAPEPWTAGLREGAPVRVFDEDGELLGTGTIGAGRPRNLAADDDDGGDRWQCEFEFSIEGVVAAPNYVVEVAGLPPEPAEANPLEPDTVVVPVSTPLDADLIEACSEELSGVVGEWRAANSYWARGVQDLCNNGLRIRNIIRQCHPDDLPTLYIVSVLTTGGRVLEDRTSDGPTVDTDTLEAGTLVDVNVTTAVPCGS